MAERRRLFWPVAVLGLGSAALAAVAVGQSWGSAEITFGGQVRRQALARGTDVAPLALALSLVALASWGTVLVLRGRARRMAAGVGLLAALGLVATLLASYSRVGDVARGLLGDEEAARSSVGAWYFVALATACATVVTLAAAVALAPRWPAMSARYDPPDAKRDSERADLWKALDEGHDPTA